MVDISLALPSIKYEFLRCCLHPIRVVCMKINNYMLGYCIVPPTFYVRTLTSMQKEIFVLDNSNIALQNASVCLGRNI